MIAQLHGQAKLKPSSVPSFTPVRNSLLQRKCACGNTPWITGECEECRKKKLGIQTKLKINRPGDKYEQEADRVAELVMRMLVSQNTNTNTGTATETSSVPPIVYDVLRSPGQPLDTTTRTFMEPRFGHDFRRVRVHTDGKAGESARAINALAYTVGENIVFGTGQHAPTTVEGRSLLIHELTHVVQQQVQEVPGSELHLGPVESWPEREAEKIAASHDMGRPRNIRTAIIRPLLQRQINDQGTGSGALPTSTNRCYTCQIPGGVGVCCYVGNTPIVPECLELGKRIIDACDGPPNSCLQEAQCAQCQCIGRKLGERYCQCTGIV